MTAKCMCRYEYFMLLLKSTTYSFSILYSAIFLTGRKKIYFTAKKFGHLMLSLDECREDIYVTCMPRVATCTIFSANVLACSKRIDEEERIFLAIKI